MLHLLLPKRLTLAFMIREKNAELQLLSIGKPFMAVDTTSIWDIKQFFKFTRNSIQ
jgi:hypothetical protein